MNTAGHRDPRVKWTRRVERQEDEAVYRLYPAQNTDVSNVVPLHPRPRPDGPRAA